MSINKYINQLSVSIRRCREQGKKGEAADRQDAPATQAAEATQAAGASFGTGQLLCWKALQATTSERKRKRERRRGEREDDKNGNMAFKVHKMAVIHALLLRGHNEWMNERPQKGRQGGKTKRMALIEVPARGAGGREAAAAPSIEWENRRTRKNITKMKRSKVVLVRLDGTRDTLWRSQRKWYTKRIKERVKGSGRLV